MLTPSTVACEKYIERHHPEYQQNTEHTNNTEQLVKQKRNARVLDHVRQMVRHTLTPTTTNKAGNEHCHVHATE